jgi:hypothetical protein
MIAKLDTPEARAIYGRQLAMVRPIFGHRGKLVRWRGLDSDHRTAPQSWAAGAAGLLAVAWRGLRVQGGVYATHETCGVSW